MTALAWARAELRLGGGHDPRQHGRLRGLRLLGDGQCDSHLVAERVAGRRPHEPEEVALDPFAGEVVGHDDDERLVAQVRPACGAEPRRVGGLVESLPQTPGDVVPKMLGSAFAGVLQRGLRRSSRGGGKGASIPPFRGTVGPAQRHLLWMQKAGFAGDFPVSTQVSTAVDNMLCYAFTGDSRAV